MTTMKITVTTVQHGFALEIDNKSWLLDNEQQLVEAVAYRVGLGCMQKVSKARMRRLLTAIAYGRKDERGAVSRKKRSAKRSKFNF